MAKRERTVVAVFAPGATIPKGWQQLKGADVAKRMTTTDRKRAEQMVWDLLEKRDKDRLFAKLEGPHDPGFRFHYDDEIGIVEASIRLGRSLERAGGKPGKGKGGGK